MLWWHVMICWPHIQHYLRIPSSCRLSHCVKQIVNNAFSRFYIQWLHVSQLRKTGTKLRNLSRSYPSLEQFTLHSVHFDHNRRVVLKPLLEKRNFLWKIFTCSLSVFVKNIKHFFSRSAFYNPMATSLLV